MDITSLIKAILVPQEEQASGTGWSRLLPGDRLSGRILKLENDGRILIDLGGSRALAETSVPVRQGQVLQLEVVRVGVTLHLRVLNQEKGPVGLPVPEMNPDGLFSREEQQRIAGLLDRVLARDQGDPMQAKLPDTVRQAALALRTLFDALPLEKEESAEIASGLRTRVEDRGLFFEKKVADAVMERNHVQTSVVIGNGEEALSRNRDFSPAAQTGGRPLQPKIADELGAKLKSSADALAQQPPLADTASASTDVEPQSRSSGVATIGSDLETAAKSAAGAQAGQEVLQAVAVDGPLIGEGDSSEGQKTPSPDKMPSGERRPLQVMLMRDLKAQLLVLQSYLSETAGPDGGPDREIGDLAKHIQKLLAHVELQQERTVQRAEEGSSLQVVTHWIALEEQSRPLKLKVYYPPNKQKGGQGQYYRVAMLLDMDRLGMVRADLACMEKHLKVDFFVDREDSRMRIEEHKESVLQVLRPDFDEVAVTVHIAKEKIDNFDREDQGAGRSGRIDIQV